MGTNRIITFAFKHHVSKDRQDEILVEIDGWKDIESAGRVNPDTKQEDLCRFCYAYLCKDADTSQVLKRVSSMDEIDSASTPTSRGLV